jgi:hypothetical protein
MIVLKRYILAFIIGFAFGLLIAINLFNLYRNDLEPHFRLVNNFGVYLVDNKSIFSYFELPSAGEEYTTGILGIGTVNICFSCLSEQKRIISEEIKKIGKDIKLGFIIGIKTDNDKVLLRNFFFSDTMILWFSVPDSVVNSFLGLNFAKNFQTFIYCAIRGNKLVSFYIPEDSEYTHFRAWIRKTLIRISQ